MSWHESEESIWEGPERPHACGMPGAEIVPRPCRWHSLSNSTRPEADAYEAASSPEVVDPPDGGTQQMNRFSWLGCGLAGILASRCCWRVATASSAGDGSMAVRATGTPCLSCCPLQSSHRPSASTTHSRIPVERRIGRCAGRSAVITLARAGARYTYGGGKILTLCLSHYGPG